MERRERLAAQLLVAGLLLAAGGLIVANIDSLLGGGTLTRAVRLAAGLVLLLEGAALTLGGGRSRLPAGRRLVRAYILERFYGSATTVSGRVMAGAARLVLGPALFLLGLVLVGFGALELTRVP